MIPVLGMNEWDQDALAAWDRTSPRGSDWVSFTKPTELKLEFIWAALKQNVSKFFEDTNP